MRLKPRRRSREDAPPQMEAEREAERQRRARPKRPKRPRRPQRPRRPRQAPASDRFAVGARSALVDLLGIVREVFAWPLRLWLSAAEVLGEFVLAAWTAAILPVLRLALRFLRGALRLGEREVTPARGLVVVALAATVALGGSQFADYRAVEVGAPEYRSVQGVAPVPEVDQQSPRSAHGVSVFAIAVASVFAIVFAAARNWRLARLLLFGGLAVVLISLIADAPQGLREGQAAIEYQGAQAVLLGGFWVQLFCGVTLMVIGPVLAVQLRAQRDARRAGPAPGASRRGLSGALEPSTGGSRYGGAAT
jgi:hypothetical protein